MALDARYLKRNQRALGGLYQSVLRAELTHRYGVGWGADRERPGRDRRHARRAAGGVLEAHRPGRQLPSPTRSTRSGTGRDATRPAGSGPRSPARPPSDTRAAKTGASAVDLATAGATRPLRSAGPPTASSTAMRAAARAAPAREPVTLADVVEQLSADGSTWTRADVLRAVCDLAPPVSQMSGHDWAAADRGRLRPGRRACASPSTRPARGPGPRLRRPVDLARADRAAPHPRARPRPGGTHPPVRHRRPHEAPARPSPTVDRAGLDVLQADAAAAVAGHDRLVLVVGPAGTGKTTMLRRAADDLRRNHRPVFGVAPTAKAAKVLRDETGIPADTVAKLLHEWRHRPARRRLPTATRHHAHRGRSRHGRHRRPRPARRARRVPAVATGPRRRPPPAPSRRPGRHVRRAVPHRPRPRARHHPPLPPAVGTGRVPPAARRQPRRPRRLHRPRPRHRRHLRAARRRRRPRWIDHTAAGRSVAVVAETNEHVDALNAAIHRHAGSTANSAVGSSVSQGARQRLSATSSPPVATTGPCAPTAANPSATATAGPSSTSAGTAASPCHISTGTVR